MSLDKKFKSRGLRILAFPCNQFGNQEPGNAAQIRATADRYRVGFDMMAKIDVNGPNTDPVYKLLKASTDNQDISWNFGAVYLVSPGGKIERIVSIGPQVSPSLERTLDARMN